MHYAKGSHAKKHKYIAIKNGRYIYPEDVKKTSNREQEKGKAKTEQENINAAIDWRRDAPSSNRAMLTAREEQKKGFKRTINEQDKQREEAGFKRLGSENKYVERAALKGFAERNMAATKSAKAAQEAGKKRTQAIKDAEKKRIAEKSHSIREKQKYEKEMKDAKKEKTTTMREWKRRNAELHAGNFDKAREHEKKSDLANRVYWKGADAAYSDRTETYKRKGKKVTNKTAKKNQAKNSIKEFAFKSKYRAKKFAKALKKKIGTGKTTYTVTDVSTGKSRNVTPTSSSSKDTINIKELTEKNKKKRR
jgi:hypothetical protein